MEVPLKLFLAALENRVPLFGAPRARRSARAPFVKHCVRAALAVRARGRWCASQIAAARRASPVGALLGHAPAPGTACRDDELRPPHTRGLSDARWPHADGLAASRTMTSVRTAMLIEPLRTSPHFESDDGRVWCDRAVGEDHVRVSARAVAWFRGGDRKSCVSIVAAARRTPLRTAAQDAARRCCGPATYTRAE